MKYLRLALLACMTAAMADGCSALPLFRSNTANNNYWSEAQQAFANHNYEDAITYYQRLMDEYPFSPYAEEAELKIGLAYYLEGHFPEAIGALNDFARMHPTSKNLALATYYLAMAHYVQIGRIDQDQTNTEQALAQFGLLEHQFPESEFADLARQQIAECREMLARHHLMISDFYLKRANFRAGESRLAELMQKYPDTAVAPQALYELATTLEKEGKKYSAAQAYAALQIHYPKTTEAAKASIALRELNEPVDTEDDPLQLVLAETGFGAQQQTAEDEAVATAADSGALAPNTVPAEGLNAPAPTGGPAHKPPKAEAAPNEPVTLRTIRLASSDPPLSVIFDLSGPVQFDKQIENGEDSSTLTVELKNTTPAAELQHHLVFDRSIFKDCDITSDAKGTTVTVNTAPIARFAIVPLEGPPRLLVTFTPRSSEGDQTAASGY